MGNPVGGSLLSAIPESLHSAGDFEEPEQELDFPTAPVGGQHMTALDTDNLPKWELGLPNTSSENLYKMKVYAYRVILLEIISSEV